MDLTKYRDCRAHKQWLFVSNAPNPYRPCCWFRTNIQATDHQDYANQLEKLDIEQNCSYCIKMEENDGGEWSKKKMEIIKDLLKKI